MAPSTGTEQPYAVALGELWPGLVRTLSLLDALAADPAKLDSETATAALARLQYSLHVGSEHVYGIEPPAGAETAHADLADALACARDATAEVAEAAEWGTAGVQALLPEWRGALFRVRLARLRLAMPDPRVEVAVEPEEPRSIARPLVAFVLALAGAAALVGGAVFAIWPLSAAGIAAVGASVVSYRP